MKNMTCHDLSRQWAYCSSRYGSPPLQRSIVCILILQGHDDRLLGKSSASRRFFDLRLISYVHGNHPYVQQTLTILDLFTTVFRVPCKEWDWGARFPYVPSVVAQQMPV